MTLPPYIARATLDLAAWLCMSTTAEPSTILAVARQATNRDGAPESKEAP